MSTEQERISYALAKQVPAMARGFTISTSYGDIQIDAEDAEADGGAQSTGADQDGHSNGGVGENGCEFHVYSSVR